MLYFIWKMKSWGSIGGASLWMIRSRDKLKKMPGLHANTRLTPEVQHNGMQTRSCFELLKNTGR